MEKTGTARSGPVCNRNAMQSIETQNPHKRSRRQVVAASARGRGSRTAARMLALAGIVWLALGPLVAGALAGNPPPSGGEFTLRRATIDAGGGEGQGADFSLKGTVGQHDTEVMTGSDFTLRGGFWTPSGPSDFLFRDGFES